jgi:glycosyltransferase involved in cell wall biosynthesis
LAQTTPVRVVVLPERRGAAVCRNIGLGLADTKFVLFLDADDYVEGPLLRSAEAAAEAAGADLVLGRFSFEYPNGRRKPIHRYQSAGDLDCSLIMKKWLLGHYTPPCAIVWRRSFVRDLGGWDEALAKNQDGDLIYRALLQTPALGCCADGQGVYVQDENPGRITKQQNCNTLASQRAVLNKIRDGLAGLSFDPRPELSVAYYNLARQAYSHGENEIGRAAERTARELGLKGQPGHLSHSVMARCLGLRRKQLVSRYVRRMIGLD